MGPHLNHTADRFSRTADALLRAEELVHAYRDRKLARMTELLADCEADVHGSLLALVIWADQAVKDAAEQRGVSEELYLRGLAAAVLSVYASSKEDA